MSSHYPPLANGAYRYGDPAQPLPSPVPGPPTSQPVVGPYMTAPPAPNLALPQSMPPGGTPAFFGPPHGVPHPAVPPPPVSSPVSGSFSRWLLPVAAVALLLFVALFAVTAMISGGNVGDPDEDGLRPPVSSRPFGSNEFEVYGNLTIESTREEPVMGRTWGCDLPVTLSDLNEGSSVVLRDSSRRLLAETRLEYATGGRDYCVFMFEFDSVPAGETGYDLQIPGRGSLTYSEAELRAGIEISLGG